MVILGQRSRPPRLDRAVRHNFAPSGAARRPFSITRIRCCATFCLT